MVEHIASRRCLSHWSANWRIVNSQVYPLRVVSLKETKVADVQRRYPIGTFTAGTGVVSTVVIWFATTVFRLPLDAAGGAAVASLIISALSFVGRRGLKGVLTVLWRGDD